MFYYWTRKTVDERLGMSLWQSYSLCPATPSGRIRTDFVSQAV